MSPFSEQESLIQSRIADWLERNNEDLSDEERRDIVFHMTDWFIDYEELRTFFDDPENATDQTIEKALGMLYHAPNHLAAVASVIYHRDPGIIPNLNPCDYRELA